MTSGILEGPGEEGVYRMAFCEVETAHSRTHHVFVRVESISVRVCSLQGTNDPLSALKPVKHCALPIKPESVCKYACHSGLSVWQ